MKEKVNNILLVVAGNFLLAISSVYFVLPFSLLTGGVAGIAVVFNKFTGFNETLMIDILMVSLFLVGAVLLGKEFALNTLISTIVYPVMISILSYFPYKLDISSLLASVYAGVFMGAGVGLVFRTGGSTGGMDVPPLLVNKYLGLNLATGTLIFDGLVCLVGILAYGIEACLVGLIAVYVSSMMIDKVLLFGGQQTKGLYIVSRKWNDINDHIINKMSRGATIIQANGGFTGEKRPILFVVIKQAEYIQLKKVINEVDPTAFVIVVNATEVSGEGFTYNSFK